MLFELAELLVIEQVIAASGKRRGFDNFHALSSIRQCRT